MKIKREEIKETKEGLNIYRELSITPVYNFINDRLADK